MESPPSFSTLSEAPPLSEDSGLLITSGSFSSDSASGWHHVASECQESDFDERSLSLCESTEASERMCGDFFNTVKKGPVKAVPPIEPPPEFQDNPIEVNVESCTSDCEASGSVSDNEFKATSNYKSVVLKHSISSKHISPLRLKPESAYERRQCLSGRFASPRLLHLSPGRGGRPASRSSLSSRLSSSHNSLVTQFQADDSSFITQAISHDTLSAATAEAHSSDITDMYNVPFDSDIYAVPVDVVRPSNTSLKSRNKKLLKYNKKRGKSTPQKVGTANMSNEKKDKMKDSNKVKDVKTKRHSLPSSSGKKSMTDSDTDAVPFITMKEMRKYLHTIYSSSTDSDYRENVATTVTDKSNGVFSVSIHARQQNVDATNASSNANNAVFLNESKELPKTVETNNNHKKANKNSVGTTNNVKSKKGKDKDSASKETVEAVNSKSGKDDKALVKKSPSSPKVKISPVKMLSMNLKESFCNLFRWRRGQTEGGAGGSRGGSAGGSMASVIRRALPPLPHTTRSQHVRRSTQEAITDFATSIQLVKDYGWYWGPITVEAAEKILSNEPDGSFIVRDSSDDHYIFTLTFKLNGLRHVRIEHEQGNFCFGGCTMFKASTIVEFIENAVETSRSGRYLFFLNLRPVLGPVRVQLLYPVSRFKHVQSLQHMCRFVILKHVRRDLIHSLPLPRRLLDYLCCTHYYSELLAEI